MQGDNKLPEGEYYIIQKAKGPFAGKWGHYLGKRWMRISYPNKKDAISGLKRKIITQKQYDEILKATKEQKEPPKSTKLGGGIGIHGWIEEDWSNDENRDLTWGCITMHNKDIIEFYDLLKGKVKIIILK
jgi:murein L,D-transpeptidase YafK